MTPKEIELLAAAAIRDAGISLPLAVTFRKQPLRVTMKMPSLRSLIRVTELYHKMGVTAKDYAGYTLEQRAEFIRLHARTMSRIVAFGIVRGRFLGLLLNRPVAWYLRGTMEPFALCEAWKQVLNAINTIPFEGTIASFEAINRLSPMLSHSGKRSQGGDIPNPPIAFSA